MKLPAMDFDQSLVRDFPLNNTGIKCLSLEEGLNKCELPAK
jgi:hypothetical protein